METLTKHYGKVCGMRNEGDWTIAMEATNMLDQQKCCHPAWTKPDWTSIWLGAEDIDYMDEFLFLSTWRDSFLCPLTQPSLEIRSPPSATSNEP
ncbi:hypothetical protein CPSG_01301 [Coccidioides posadasii str. Silveira]|uniref:Uncharacterized protein n=1 Tax=Coccidioides posadasii (strain RMSCC 757 / Silveira) TaxID=443226 RepID=E9CSD2_COCPS|nr:hypothetical protein CPSG_01301 [Coccidioides posadasii str. Silveira]